jgi:hypothetical protein
MTLVGFKPTVVFIEREANESFVWQGKPVKIVDLIDLPPPVNNQKPPNWRKGSQTKN